MPLLYFTKSLIHIDKLLFDMPHFAAMIHNDNLLFAMPHFAAMIHIDKLLCAVMPHFAAMTDKYFLQQFYIDFMIKWHCLFPPPGWLKFQIDVCVLLCQDTYLEADVDLQLKLEVLGRGFKLCLRTNIPKWNKTRKSNNLFLNTEADIYSILCVLPRFVHSVSGKVLLFFKRSSDQMMCWFNFFFLCFAHLK